MKYRIKEYYDESIRRVVFVVQTKCKFLWFEWWSNNFSMHSSYEYAYREIYYLLKADEIESQSKGKAPKYYEGIKLDEN